MKSERFGHRETFNARFLYPKEVGETFVNSPFLDDIVAPNHTAVLGPRGSGKTTLLKMLTLPAMLSWKDPARDDLAAALKYLSVYIPSSLTWNADFRGFSGDKLTKDVDDLVSVSLFRHCVLFSLLNTWQEASRAEVKADPHLERFYLPIEIENEAELVRALARAWQLELPISTIGGVREAISLRLRQLQALSVRASYVGLSLERALTDFPFVASHFMDDCSAFADFLKEHYGFERQLALCFDEIEIAPDAVANVILQIPRSVDQRFFVKFSAAPYVGIAASLREPTVPTQKQDYKFVLLSSFSAKETRTFSEALFASLAKKYDIYEPSNRVLGSSLVDDFATSISQIGSTSRYHANGAYQRKFESLHRVDLSFASYAQQKGIDVNDLTHGNENERAALIRKIIWSVLIREEFLFQPDAAKATRGRVRRLRTAHPISDIYTGAASLFAITEGNPRQIIGLMEPMLKAYKDKRGAVVRRSLQSRLVEKMIAAYFALVATVPAGHQMHGIGSLVDVVSRIGNYFKKAVLGPDFDPDPVLSFIIDEQLSPELRELLGRGINIGAFVIADVTKAGGVPYRLGDIVGLKARLSNTFAAHFKLPLAGGRTVNLSTILKRSDSTSQPLLELFGEKI